MNSRTVYFQDFLKGPAKLFLRIVGRGGIIRPEITDIRFRERHTIHLAVGLERNFINLDEISRNHIVGQTLHELISELFRIEFDFLLIICTQETLFVVVESPCGSPFDSQGLSDCSFDLCRLDPVAVDLDHISASAQQDITAIGIPAGKVSGVIEAIPERSLRLLGEIEIAADIGILKAEFSRLSVRHFLSVLVDQPDLCADFGFSDRAGLIGLVDFKDSNCKSTFTGRIDIHQLNILVVDIVGRFTSHEQHT